MVYLTTLYVASLVYFHTGSLLWQFNWTLDTSTSGPVDALFNLAKTRLPSMLKEKLAEFPNALIETHGKDLTVSGEPSRSTTPQAPGAVSTTAAASTADQKVNKERPAPKAKAINTETVVVSASFQASADDLFSILTDEKRIPHWSRAPAQVGSLTPIQVCQC